ncbi:M1 family metallopeptidase [Pedobacter cryoconitis]|uniref:Aminopeptidase N n=1 Tax=Pedobacter cryoconitis TaxID=188932 RepID=A0A7X0J656_9SPHI|nr:M1 family metallopeptidase [Pedobacter cryoconitis]MBB6501555.1 aminopeptidase N [Pedobacter cryoconitis]
MTIKPKNYHRAVMNTMLIIGTAIALPAFAQKKADDPLLKIYRASAEKINDLIHTKLDVRFDYKKRYLYGKEWVTIKPHIYATDSLRLDAKGMDIKTVAVVKNGENIPLKYTYDNLSLAIKLDKTYQNTENYTIYIDYTAKPDELKLEAGAAITDAKGLYFINPDSTEKGKPVQIWTQGELESSSAWFPTIDRTNQKTTDEISMTVPGKYVTLSNGRLASQKKNADGTRTDTWKMELPHSPYLFMMAVGDFKIYRDKWRDKEVSYYLEPEYAPYAKDIFGFTPEVIEFYSKTLGVDYPWNKYSQIVVRDYVSGAMENTTATLHGSYVQGTARELADRYYDKGRSTIVHELFHQWFGDYVTAESWSNITVNESFADFSEMLWAEHKYGQDTGDDHNNEALQIYLENPANATKDLVRFHYHAAQDVFDAVSYKKGGRILNMLRNYLTPPVFFKGLSIYLKTNAFKNGEAHQLRLAMEEASGKDLNWFFNQWYFGAGHPVLDISYKWNESTKTQTVYLNQTQEGNAFQLPMQVDIYNGTQKERHQIWMNSKSDTLNFKLAAQPKLVNVDADKITLCKKTDHKSIAEFLFQYQHAPLYLDRLEAIDAAIVQQTDPLARQLLLAALQDKYYGLRIKTMSSIDPANTALVTAALPVILKIAQSDENNLAKAQAMKIIGSAPGAAEQLPLFNEGLKNSSYAVQGAALQALATLKPNEALNIAKTFEKDNKGDLTKSILSIYAKSGSDTEWPFVYKNYKENDPQAQFEMLRDFSRMTAQVKNPEYAQQGITELKKMGINYKSQGAGPIIISVLNQIKTVRQQQNDNASVKTIDEAVQQINDK